MRHSKTTEQLTSEIISAIKLWFDGDAINQPNGKDCRAIIGISGGKDSSVVAALCVAALGKERVHGILMPCGVQKDIDCSYALCEHLGISYSVANIHSAVSCVLGNMVFAGVEVTSQTRTNLPARIRMATLYAFSQSLNGRVMNTCNRSEDIVGYFTKFGDGAGDFAPLAMLTVREVIAIGEYLGLPRELTRKTPVDGLNENPDGSYVTDEQSLGVSYEDIDDYLDGFSVHPYIEAIIKDKIARSAFKLSPMPHYDPSDNTAK